VTRALRQPARSASVPCPPDEPVPGAHRAAARPPTELATAHPHRPCNRPGRRPGHTRRAASTNAPAAGTGSPANVAAPTATCSPDASARAAAAPPAARSSPSANCSTSHNQPTPKLSDPTPTINNEKEPPPEGHLHRTRDATGFRRGATSQNRLRTNGSAFLRTPGQAGLSALFIPSPSRPVPLALRHLLRLLLARNVGRPLPLEIFQGHIEAALGVCSRSAPSPASSAGSSG